MKYTNKVSETKLWNGEYTDTYFNFQITTIVKTSNLNKSKI